VASTLTSDLAPRATGTSERGWIVTYVLDLTHGTSTLDDFAVEQIYKTLLGRSPVVAVADKRASISFSAEGKDARQATTDAARAVAGVFPILNVKWTSVLSTKIVTNALIDEEISSLPRCVGVGEAAEILGVSKQRVVQLAKTPGFPDVAVQLRATPVWTEASIRTFAESRHRTRVAVEA
jgi:hypothetical protein